ncbi:hypothetical protein BpHYR1_025388 [Brachionus plicatilis]|uniref:Uncharacterized protein n=1 Tax=Brachionus plicatilis TaxID=10195 RepID=A0A3M7PLQ8_BRAPC|nr:hypothetical protein BpHYR1_001515 [Brachionus plicatilis]RNA00043.1 hypothetical protein BpHYR1_025388 [Brachionus plicatilis]
MLLIVLFIPVFLNLIPSTNGLKCYVCNGCSTAESLTDCPSGQNYCLLSNHIIFIISFKGMF